MATNYVTAWMEEQTNVHIAWSIIQPGDADIKIDRILASGDTLPDAVFGGEYGEAFDLHF
jgi:putative aldouronate transport system substrate-binding protein